ncbi:hypothetical protein JM18_009468 [Phytophthora kernoviae]|uniref:RxLR effector protein n=2 Tax=Phytophthora kernoviae TaxID=325452 RepID=A0A8T0M5C9_9STRA|nr:hypothetical protein G195_002836 [Phytophthora kernoviae 00238/432]KAG2505744.1 hypothetical protein JM18_009468 [Phytophthora kernoviae]KAG2529548.1 hypothetical protein JM16_002015 [Phytophthora kernoviae]
MRPYNVLLLTLVLLFAFSNAVLAVTPVTTTAVSNEANYKRSLRVAETTTNSVDDEEERGLTSGLTSGLNKLKEKTQLYNMRLAASKEIKMKDAAIAKAAKAVKAAEKADAKAAQRVARAEKKAADKAAKVAKAAEKARLTEAAKVAKAEAATAAKAANEVKNMEKTEAILKTMLAKHVSPDKVKAELGLTKLGAKAEESKLYPLFVKYVEDFNKAPANAVLAVTPATATAVNNEADYKRSLRAAETTANSVDDEEERGLTSGLTSGISKLKEKAQLYKMRSGAAKEIKLKDAAAAKAVKAAAKTDKLKAKEKSMINGWLNKLRTPEKVYKDLGLKQLGDKATESKNYRIYEEYMTLYYKRVDELF